MERKFIDFLNEGEKFTPPDEISKSAKKIGSGKVKSIKQTNDFIEVSFQMASINKDDLDMMSKVKNFHSIFFDNQGPVFRFKIER